MKKIYNYEISPEAVSRITDAVIDRAREWQTRPLEPIYAIVFMDAIFLKLRVDGRVKNVAAYLMIGIDLKGKKECLGIWLGQSESSKYWLRVLNELRNRGVNDVLIFVDCEDETLAGNHGTALNLLSGKTGKLLPIG